MTRASPRIPRDVPQPVQQRDHIGRFVKVCEGCGIYPADLPSKLCPGCEAYQEHQR